MEEQRLELEAEKKRRMQSEADFREMEDKLWSSRGIIKQLQESYPSIPRYMPTDSEYHSAYESRQES